MRIDAALPYAGRADGVRPLRIAVAMLLIAIAAPASATVALACSGADAGVELQIELSAAPGADVVGLRLSGPGELTGEDWTVVHQSIDYAHRRVRIEARGDAVTGSRTLTLEDRRGVGTLRIGASAARQLSCAWDAIG